jgi:endonuclease G, mitochondrial
VATREPGGASLVQAALRKVADEYLADPNITSVAVAYKEVDGRRTDRLSLQFTVGRKMAPDGVEAAATGAIPERITVNGITFDTDVVESADDDAPAAAAAGFDPDFLPGHPVALPEPAGAEIERDVAPTLAGERVRDYTHFSLSMSAGRRFCRWVAWNIDGGGLRQLPRKGIDFVLDDAYRAEDQVDDTLYARNDLDRGHIARRADLLWGDLQDARQANVDSFFFTNITPQLADFNQSGQQGLWGELEEAVFADTDIDDLKVSVLGGPVFKETDFAYRGILVPRSFWKIIAYVEEGQLRAKAFVLTQDDLETKLASLGLEPFRLFQITLAELAEMTGLDHGELVAADAMTATPQALAAPSARRIESRVDIVVD